MSLFDLLTRRFNLLRGYSGLADVVYGGVTPLHSFQPRRQSRKAISVPQAAVTQHIVATGKCASGSVWLPAQAWYCSSDATPHAFKLPRENMFRRVGSR